MLHNAFLRVRVDERVESLQRKLAEAWQGKACYVVVISQGGGGAPVKGVRQAPFT